MPYPTMTDVLMRTNAMAEEMAKALQAELDYGPNETEQQLARRRDRAKAISSKMIKLFCRKLGRGWRLANRREARWINKDWFLEDSDGLRPPEYHKFFDHAFHFINEDEDDEYAIASHLYDVDTNKKNRIELFAKEHGLEATFPHFPTWWYPERTTFVWWTQADQETSGL